MVIVMLCAYLKCDCTDIYLCSPKRHVIPSFLHICKNSELPYQLHEDTYFNTTAALRIVSSNECEKYDQAVSTAIACLTHSMFTILISFSLQLKVTLTMPSPVLAVHYSLVVHQGSNVEFVNATQYEIQPITTDIGEKITSIILK